VDTFHDTKTDTWSLRMTSPGDLKFIVDGTDLCFNHGYKGKHYIVTVTRELLDDVLKADKSLDSRGQKLQEHLPQLLTIVEQKIDDGQEPVIYARDVKLLD
jgi:hypothetical protein